MRRRLIILILGGLLLGVGVAGAASVVATIPVGNNPEGLAVNPLTNRAYVTNISDSDISVIDGVGNAVIATVNVGSGPFDVAVNPTTNRIYVTNANDGTVSVLDGTSNTLITTIPVPGGNLRDIEVNPTTNRIYVTQSFPAAVVVIDGATSSVIDTVSLASLSSGQLWGVAVNATTNRIYVVDIQRMVFVIDGATDAVIDTVAIAPSLPSGSSHEVAVNPTTNRIYVTTFAGVGFTNGLLSVIDGATDTVTAETTMGDDPFGVAVNPSTNRAYVVNADSRDLDVVDGTTSAVLTTLPLNGIPVGLAANPLTNRIYAGLQLTNTVAVIQDPDAVGPATVVLSPPDSVNNVGTSHTVTATVKNAAGGPVQGSTVLFNVQGSVTTSGSCTTGANGQCSFTYSGPQLPGADVIIGCADANSSNTVDAGDPCGTATKAWLLPTTTPGHITGGGQVLNAAGTDQNAFGFSAKSDNKGVQGECTVVDPSANVKVKCLDATTLVESGTHATVFGNATVNGAATTYRIDVDDNGEPGRGRDTFRIQTAGGYTTGGVITNGNIQVH